METDLIVRRSGAYFNYSVSMPGYDTLIRWLKQANPELKRALQRGMKKAAEPALTAARAHARAIADDGTFAESLDLKSWTSGVYLVSYDEAAGVKEFARAGATYKPKPTDKRRNARKMSSFPVGVPHRANPPRAMIPGVNESIDEIKSRIDDCLETVLRGASNG